MNVVHCDLCIIGAGSGGLSLAAVAAQMGAEVVLFERDRMGGDCLNTGCVPSKTLLAFARQAGSISDPAERYQHAKKHVASVIAAIAPHDSVDRFEGLGVRVIQAEARFVAPRVVEGGGIQVRARRVVIATGSRPKLPDIPGLSSLDYWTTDTLFASDQWPAQLLILGGGPIAFEMAQAHARLGTQVTVIAPRSLMGRDEPLLVEALRHCLEAEGVQFVCGAEVTRCERLTEGRVQLSLADGTQCVGDRLLLAAGRVANTEALNLSAAGLSASTDGIATDEHLRTSARGVFAIGDVAGRQSFTHVASAHAGIVLKQIVFGWPAKIKPKHPPWVTFTDPELAHAGLNHLERNTQIPMAQQRVLSWAFSEVDRSVCEGRTEGRIQVVTDRKGRILSVDILGQHAGELIAPWVLAIEQGLPLSAMAQTVVPYPTRSEISKRVAGSAFTAQLYSNTMRAWVRRLQRWLP